KVAARLLVMLGQEERVEAAPLGLLGLGDHLVDHLREVRARRRMRVGHHPELDHRVLPLCRAALVEQAPSLALAPVRVVAQTPRRHQLDGYADAEMRLAPRLWISDQ